MKTDEYFTNFNLFYIPRKAHNESVLFLYLSVSSTQTHRHNLYLHHLQLDCLCVRGWRSLNIVFRRLNIQEVHKIVKWLAIIHSLIALIYFYCIFFVWL